MSPNDSLSHIASDLRGLATRLEDLRPAKDNARLHHDRDRRVLMESLQRYGQRKPVVAKRSYRGQTNVVLAGNGALEAARGLGWRYLAVSWFEGSDDEARQYALVDNRSAELSNWDLEELAGQLRDLQEAEPTLLSNLGWAEQDVSVLLQAQWEPPRVEPLPSGPPALVSIVLTRDQYQLVLRAVEAVRAREGDAAMTEGRVVELLCADYLAGA